MPTIGSGGANRRMEPAPLTGWGGRKKARAPMATKEKCPRSQGECKSKTSRANGKGGVRVERPDSALSAGRPGAQITRIEGSSFRMVKVSTYLPRQNRASKRLREPIPAPRAQGVRRWVGIGKRRAALTH